MRDAIDAKNFQTDDLNDLNMEKKYNQASISSNISDQSVPIDFDMSNRVSIILKLIWHVACKCFFFFGNWHIEEI